METVKATAGVTVRDGQMSTYFWTYSVGHCQCRHQLVTREFLYDAWFLSRTGKSGWKLEHEPNLRQKRLWSSPTEEAKGIAIARSPQLTVKHKELAFRLHAIPLLHHLKILYVRSKSISRYSNFGVFFIPVCNLRLLFSHPALLLTHKNDPLAKCDLVFSVSSHSSYTSQSLD